MCARLLGGSENVTAYKRLPFHTGLNEGAGHMDKRGKGGGEGGDRVLEREGREERRKDGETKWDEGKQ